MTGSRKTSAEVVTDVGTEGFQESFRAGAAGAELLRSPCLEPRVLGEPATAQAQEESMSQSYGMVPFTTLVRAQKSGDVSL